MRRLVKGLACPHAVFRGHHSVMYRLIASCVGFGSSAADVAVGGGVVKNRCIEYQLDNQHPNGNAGLSTFQQAGNQVNNGVMCQPSTLSNPWNTLIGAGAFTESNMRYYNLDSTV